MDTNIRTSFSTDMLPKRLLLRHPALARAPTRTTAGTPGEVSARLAADNADAAYTQTRRVFDGRKSGIQALDRTRREGRADVNRNFASVMGERSGICAKETIMGTKGLWRGQHGSSARAGVTCRRC